jgi:hypothetical protein
MFMENKVERLTAVFNISEAFGFVYGRLKNVKREHLLNTTTFR